MSTLMKLVWRFDYELSFDFVNRKGDALRALSVPDFLTLRPYVEGKPVTGEGYDDDSRQNITMDAVSLSGTIDFLKELPIEAAFKSQVFRNVDRVTKELAEVGNLSRIKRGGLRFFLIQPNRSAVDYQRIISSQSLSVARGALGAVTDVASIIEGKDDDGLSYRVQYGPLAKSNIEQLVAEPFPNYAVNRADGNSLIIDLDLYEQDFTLVTPSLYRWASTKLAKAEKLTRLLAEIGSK